MPDDTPREDAERLARIREGHYGVRWLDTIEFLLRLLDASDAALRDVVQESAKRLTDLSAAQQEIERLRDALLQIADGKNFPSPLQGIAAKALARPQPAAEPQEGAPASPWYLRCLVTKNMCGTDTWSVGQPCQCKNCQLWLRTTQIPHVATPTPSSADVERARNEALMQKEPAGLVHYPPGSTTRLFNESSVERMLSAARAEALAAEREAARPVIEAARRIKKNAERVPYRDVAGLQITATPMWEDFADAFAAYDAAHPQDRAAPGKTERGNG